MYRLRGCILNWMFVHVLLFIHDDNTVDVFVLYNKGLLQIDFHSFFKTVYVFVLYDKGLLQTDFQISDIL
jgi:hypothetical protein